MRSHDRLTVIWGYCPPEVRATLRPILLDYLWLVPSWCQTLFVQWDDSPEDKKSNASSSAQPEYRQAQLYIHPGFIGSVAASRVDQVVHELLHIPLAPMVEEYDDLAKRLLDDTPRFSGYVLEQWRRVFEGAVQDLTASVSLVVGPPQVQFVEVDDDDRPPPAANEAELVRVDPRYFAHLRELERLAIADGTTTPTAWEAPA